MSIFWDIQPKYKRFEHEILTRYFENKSKIYYGKFHVIPGAGGYGIVDDYRFDKFFKITENFGLRGEKACKLYWQSHRI